MADIEKRELFVGWCDCLEPHHAEYGMYIESEAYNDLWGLHCLRCNALGVHTDPTICGVDLRLMIKYLFTCEDSK